MQGPGQPPTGRRAGDSGASGPGGGELRDWQKNTWFGPAPVNSSPFEEPDNAPELLEERSSNVNNRTGVFWEEKDPAGYQYNGGDTGRRQPEGRDVVPAGRKRERQITVHTMAVLILVLVTVVLALFFGVFRIREIRVVGNRAISSEDIIRFSGIRRGASILTLGEEETERHINASVVAEITDKEKKQEEPNYNYYRLQFRYLEKEMPGTVIITVKEREACCWLIRGGILFVMDKNGMVLYETEDLSMSERLVDLVEVKGLTIRSGAHIGQTMVLSSAAQELIFRDLFLEMKILGCNSQVSEADLSNPSSILLTTRDRFNVSLGNGESLHAKLRSMLLVRDKLKEMGKESGSINVSNPETPFYSPSSPQ